MKPSKFLFIIALFGLFGLILASCGKDAGDPPTLPPAETLIIDFSNFESGIKTAEIANVATEFNNWGFAALVAGYFRTVAAVTLAVPVYSFGQVINEVPDYLGDKTWQWSYSEVILSKTYKARLTGQIRTNDVLWEMYLTQEGTGGFPEFLWFKGTSNLEGTAGQWILNHSYQYQEPVLQIDWTKTGTAMGTVKYTYVRTLNDNRVADPLKNSYIEYGRTTGNFDSYYVIHYFNGTAFSDVNVEWNSTTHNGRVKCNTYFGDNLWHCWNNNLVNITCP
jgi:hypothetical protein